MPYYMNSTYPLQPFNVMTEGQARLLCVLLRCLLRRSIRPPMYYRRSKLLVCIPPGHTNRKSHSMTKNS
ncbi:hypothetical protein B0I35DRAFT_443913 [Stachybotrys elegans]|uniref:Uncharacterized protein n=1 Tax=Stachybotrys elegans TaxID=80388 RepID=A0A8K0SKC3_9HYPO|nr:hypothetical protein B0I35DRAFT_443913 [Stachybotrys elegans]